MVADAVHDAVFGCPSHGLREPASVRHVCEGILPSGRASGVAPEHRDEHGARHAALRLKHAVADAVHQTVRNGVVDALVVPAPGVHVVIGLARAGVSAVAGALDVPAA